MESEDEDNNFLIFTSKKDYEDLVLKMIDELKEKIVFTEILNKLLLYHGISGVYRHLNINDTILHHLNKITKYTQEEWVNDVCWNIHKTVCVAFESLPFSIVKQMTLYQLEKYTFKIIFNSLSSVDNEGYLDFIEEKNIYLEEESDLVTEINDEIYDDFENNS